MPAETQYFHKACQRRNVPGHAHFLTFSCFRRQPFLIKDRSRQWFLNSLNRALSLHHMDLLAWVIMPEHVHLIIRPTLKEYSISKFLTSLKQPVTNKAIHYVRQHSEKSLTCMSDVQPSGECIYRFWQRGGGYDRNLWSACELWEKIDYIHRNPVTRGLADRPERWPWSSAQDFISSRECSPVILNKDFLPVRVS